MDAVRTIALVSASAMAVCQFALCAYYFRLDDWRFPLPLGYGLAMVYIVVEQESKWGQPPTWRTYLAIASSMVGWWAVYRLRFATHRHTGT